MHNPSLAERLEALSIAQSDEQKTTVLLEIAKLLTDEQDFPQAQRYAQQALSIALPAQKGEAQYQLARTLFMQGEFEQVIALIEATILLFEQEAQPQEVGKCYNMLAALYTNVQDFQKALENFETAIQHNEKTQNYTELGKVFTYLAMFVRMAMPVKNIPVFYENLSAEAPPQRVAFIQHNLGVFYRQEHQQEKALQAFQTAVSLKQDHAIKYGLGETSYQIASLHDLQGNSEISYAFHIAALAQLLEDEKPEHIEIILYYLSHAIADTQDESVRQHTLALIQQAETRGYKIPQVADTEENTNEEDALIDNQFASRLHEVAQLERSLSAEELGKYYAQNKDLEIGLIWLKKLLNQYNNAWLGRKAKFKIYEDAKAQILQDIDNQLTDGSLSEDERVSLLKTKETLL